MTFKKAPDILYVEFRDGVATGVLHVPANEQLPAYITNRMYPVSIEHAALVAKAVAKIAGELP